MNVEYCTNVLLRVKGSCEECGLVGTIKCKNICKDVEEKLKSEGKW